MRWLVFIITMTSCGLDDRPPKDLNAELSTIRAEFFSDLREYGIAKNDIDLRKMRFESYSDETLGHCRFKTSPTGRQWREIGISAQLKGARCSIRLVMYHELAHCYLEAGHDNEGLMAPTTNVNDEAVVCETMDSIITEYLERIAYGGRQ